jgi:hypothetical protein
MRRLSPAALVFLAWTLLIWGTRIGNIWRGDDGGTGTRLADTALAASFVVLVLAVAVAAVRAVSPTTVYRVVVILAGWTAGVWMVRSVDILADDWSVGFKVVHTALAVVSLALAALAVRSLRSPGPVGLEPSKRDRPAIPVDPPTATGDAPMRSG